MISKILQLIYSHFPSEMEGDKMTDNSLTFFYQNEKYKLTITKVKNQ
jgi:hypothetical protein